MSNACRSRPFAKALGVLLVLATVSYLVDVAFLLPGLAEQILGYLGIVPAIAEIWMVLYVLIVGVRPSWDVRLRLPGLANAVR